MGVSAIKRLFCCPTSHWLNRVTVGATFVCLAATVGTPFYWEPQLKVGEFVATDIKAPRTINITDIETTRLAKERIKQEVPQVYRFDRSLNQQSIIHLEELLTEGDRLLALAGDLPYTSFLSYSAQLRLRMVSDFEWQNFMAGKSPKQGFFHELLAQKSELAPSTYQKLIAKIAIARQRYQTAQQSLLASPELFRGRLLNLSKAEWQASKIAARRSLEDILANGVVAGLPPEVKQYRITNSQYLPQDTTQRLLVIDLISMVLVPNLQPDYLARQNRVARVLESLQPQMITIKAGAVIVRAGQEITEREFIFLDELQLTQRRPNFWGIGFTVLAVAGSMVVFKLSVMAQLKLKCRDLLGIAIVVCSSMIATVVISNTAIAFIPLASMAMILGSFYGSRLATVTTGLSSGLVAIAISPTLVAYLPMFLGGLVAAILTNRPNTRSRISLNGVAVALVQTGTYLTLAIFLGNVAPLVLGLNALQYAASGLLASVIALGAIPYLEQICYAITPIRLAELANLDRPLLQKLVTEAPGTFQHTLFVANLAEAGARALGADTALVRTGTLYHDIGKTIHPEYFIENQMGLTNPHEILDNPWASADIIREHVTGGLKLAQKYHLPPLLQTFIPEHQGTIVISYFYHQAQLRSPLALEDEFRYIGPIPQSRETGIVMLADASEAALRSLGSETTLEEATAMMLRIFNSRWQQGQLANSGLTQEDLEKLAPVFIQVWRQRNHGRIKYPDFATKVDPSGASLPVKCAADKVLSGRS